MNRTYSILLLITSILGQNVVGQDYRVLGYSDDPNGFSLPLGLFDAVNKEYYKNRIRLIEEMAKSNSPFFDSYKNEIDLLKSRIKEYEDTDRPHPRTKIVVILDKEGFYYVSYYSFEAAPFMCVLKKENLAPVGNDHIDTKELRIIDDTILYIDPRQSEVNPTGPCVMKPSQMGKKNETVH